MQFFFKTLLILTCLVIIQIQSLPLSEEAHLSIDNPHKNGKSANINTHEVYPRFLQGSPKTKSTSAKITLKSGKWVAAIVGGAVVITICIGCALFWCIKRRLDRLEHQSVSNKIAPFRPARVDQLQYGHPGERLESDQSIIMAADNSAIPFVNANQTIQPTLLGYEKQLNTEEDFKGIVDEKRMNTEETKARGDESTIEPLPLPTFNRDYATGQNEGNFVEELANALEL